MSHDTEVIRRGKVEVLGLHQQRQVVIDAVVPDLEQEIARLATAEGALAPLVVAVEQVLDSPPVDRLEAQLGATSRSSGGIPLPTGRLRESCKGSGKRRSGKRD